MRSEEIKSQYGDDIEFATDQEMESKGVNNFQGFPIAASSVVIFPEDHIKRPKIPIRYTPNRADYAEAEKMQKLVEQLESKDSLTDEETEALEEARKKTDAKNCIPKATYLEGAAAGTTDGVLVYASYMSRWGKRTADAPKQEAIDGLTKFLARGQNNKERADMLRGKTIVVADKPTKWFVEEWIGNQRTGKFIEKSILAINVREHPECDVEQPAE